MKPFTIHPATRPGALALRVADLAAMTAFYRDVLGFHLWETGQGRTLLGSQKVPLLWLEHAPDAPLRPRRSSGLFHFAILYPHRPALAAALRRLAEQGYPLEGASDHRVSEALYLSDPEGNGIELYRDRPRATWPHERDGQIAMATLPLDLQALLAEAEPGIGSLPEGTTMGHIHLNVSQLAEAEQWYRDAVGLERMVRYGEQASFLAAGGYHHHIGMNVWRGVGAPPPPAGARGMDFFTLLLPDEAALDALRAHLHASGIEVEERRGVLALCDPSGNRLQVRPASLHAEWIG